MIDRTVRFVLRWAWMLSQVAFGIRAKRERKGILKCSGLSTSVLCMTRVSGLMYEL